MQGIERETLVYFLFAEKCNVIKIGKTNNLLNRLNAYVTASPEPLKLIGLTNQYGEREIQHKFSHIKDHNEWFRAEQELLDFIQLNCQWLCDNCEEPVDLQSDLDIGRFPNDPLSMALHICYDCQIGPDLIKEAPEDFTEEEMDMIV